MVRRPRITKIARNAPTKVSPNSPAGDSLAVPARDRREVEWMALAFGIWFSHLCALRRLLHAGFCCDSQGYLWIGRGYNLYGLFSVQGFNKSRTYGYPLFLSAMQTLAKFTGAHFDFLFFEVQLFLYVAGAWLLRRELSRYSVRYARIVFVCMCLNIYVLIYTAESLTESLSLSVTLLLAACWFWSLRAFRSRWYLLAMAIGGCLAGFAVMVRPANLYLPVMWMAAQTWLVFSRRAGTRPKEGPRRALALALTLLAVAAPMVPQFYLNSVFGHRATPLITEDLQLFQQQVGIMYIKYATAAPPTATKATPYLNPMAPLEAVSFPHPMRWYFHYPARGAATLLLHEFALIDQDLIFPYSTNLSPSYRIPLSIANHLLIGLAAYGLFLLCIRRSGPVMRISRPVMLLYIAGVFAVYAVTAVECRFGLPLMLMAPPIAVLAWRHLNYLPVRRAARPAGLIALYIVAAMITSGWMRSQSPAIYAWKSVRNLARNGTARQSSTWHGYEARSGNDGDIARGGRGGTFFHTTNEANPWWEVDLGTVHAIDEVRIFNARPYDRANTLKLLISDDDRDWRVMYENHGRPFTTDALKIALNGALARYVRVQLDATEYLHLEEVEVYGE